MFIFHIIDDINKETENAKITFHNFEKAIAYEIKRNLLEDESSRQRLRGIARALDVKGFIIQIAPTAGKVFSYPSDSNLFSIVNGNVLLKEQSKFIKVFKTEGYATIDGDQQKVYITVLMNVFPSNMIFIRSRTVFFFALALIFLTGMFRILLSIKPNEKVEKVYTSFDEKPIKYNTSYEKNYESVPSSYSSFEADFNNDVLNVPSESEIEALSMQNADSFSNESNTPTENFNNVAESAEVIVNNDEPKGLYSPTTGFGWNKYLIERLDSELKRATTTDQDISFAIIKIQDIDFSSLNLKNIFNIFCDVFLFKDMIFEYPEEFSLGYAVILQNIYIDDAIKMCDTLYSKLKKEIYLTGQEPTIGVGITTRACRLANVESILKEAEAAVARALKNKSDPIVGFRPSAEKYRQQTIEEREYSSLEV
ncbi:MAG: hypothetical protein ACTTKH_02790 [Treponema sp.]